MNERCSLQVVSVQACTIQGVYEKIRASAPHLNCDSGDEQVQINLETAISCLIENPIELYHDPEDDGKTNNFELLRFIAVG